VQDARRSSAARAAPFGLLPAASVGRGAPARRRASVGCRRFGGLASPTRAKTSYESSSALFEHGVGGLTRSALPKRRRRCRHFRSWPRSAAPGSELSSCYQSPLLAESFSTRSRQAHPPPRRRANEFATGHAGGRTELKAPPRIASGAAAAAAAGSHGHGLSFHCGPPPLTAYSPRLSLAANARVRPALPASLGGRTATDI
jgi:hypothetical protein